MNKITCIDNTADRAFYGLCFSYQQLEENGFILSDEISRFFESNSDMKSMPLFRISFGIERDEDHPKYFGVGMYLESLISDSGEISGNWEKPYFYHPSTSYMYPLAGFELMVRPLILNMDEIMQRDLDDRHGKWLNLTAQEVIERDILVECDIWAEMHGLDKNISKGLKGALSIGVPTKIRFNQ